MPFSKWAAGMSSNVYIKTFIYMMGCFVAFVRLGCNLIHNNQFVNHLGRVKAHCDAMKKEIDGVVIEFLQSSIKYHKELNFPPIL